MRCCKWPPFICLSLRLTNLHVAEIGAKLCFVASTPIVFGRTIQRFSILYTSVTIKMLCCLGFGGLTARRASLTDDRFIASISFLPTRNEVTLSGGQELVDLIGSLDLTLTELSKSLATRNSAEAWLTSTSTVGKWKLTGWTFILQIAC